MFIVFGSQKCVLLILLDVPIASPVVCLPQGIGEDRVTESPGQSAALPCIVSKHAYYLNSVIVLELTLALSEND